MFGMKRVAMKAFIKTIITVLIVLFLSTISCPGQVVSTQNVAKGVELAVQGKFKVAKVEFEKALKVDPSNDIAKTSIKTIEELVDRQTESRTAIYWFKGVANSIKGSWDNAIAEYSKAIDLNPRLAEAYCNRGLAYYNKGQNDEAISDFNKAIDLNPKFVQAYYNRGLAYSEKGQHDKAILEFNKAIDLNPKFAKAYYSRAVSYYFKEEFDKAMENIYKAQRLGHPVNSEFFKSLVAASGKRKKIEVPMK
jgi:tetratricopeptide (TPR) repeat protein